MNRGRTAHSKPKDDENLLSRRRVLTLLSLCPAGFALVGCGGPASNVIGTSGSGTPVDLAFRFAGFQLAEEPNGDLATVVWPDFVTEAGPAVQRLYEVQVVNGELMRYMPCGCGCGCGGDGHRNNRDCYITSVNRDGSVVFALNRCWLRGWLDALRWADSRGDFHFGGGGGGTNACRYPVRRLCGRACRSVPHRGRSPWAL